MDTLNTPPGVPPNSFFTPLLISVVGVSSTCIGILFYHFIFVKYCMKRTETATNQVAQPIPESPLLPTGVDKKLLETIPIIAYSAKHLGDNLFRVDQTECVVCLGELEHGEMVRLLPNCNHAFHVPCIDEWFVAHTSCPICRSPIVAEAASSPVHNHPLPPPPVQYDLELPPQEDHNERENGTSDGNNYNASSSGVKGNNSFGLLRHCGSMVMAGERPLSSARVIMGLKRSLSVDQSSVIIDIQRESGRDGSTSASTSSSKDDLTGISTAGARSIRHLDFVSSKLLSSFSRLRLGKNSEILPY